MNKKIICILVAFLLIPFITAGEFSIELNPQYYVQGKKIIWTPDVQVSSISLEVVGINHNEEVRILNLTIVDAYPLAFKEALPDTAEFLRISQEKILWVSKIIDLDDINYSSIDFWIGVEGMVENTNEVIYIEEHLNVTLIIPEKEESFLSIFGERIWEGSPTKGLFFLGGSILLGGFLIWKYKVSDKVDEWREKSERRRFIRKRNEGNFNTN